MTTRVFAVILFAVSLSAQALTDHAAAIAGASAGVAGARALRDPLTKVLDAAAGAASTGATAEPQKKAEPPKKPEVKPGNPPAQTGAPRFSASPSPAPAARAATWRQGSESRSLAIAASQSVFSATQTYMPPPPVTTAQLRAVAAGETRAEVVERLGVPVGRISMADNGHLVEILQYSANGARVGSVRCSDGKVESVNTAER